MEVEQQQDPVQGSSSASGKENLQQQQEEWWRSDGSSEDGEESGDEEGPAKGPPDPLYDPEADEADEKWMAQQREGRESDAILNCPGCFTTLCIDCQQHAEYEHQFRAMFVMNCQVDKDSTSDPAPSSKPSTGKRSRGSSAPKPPPSSQEGGPYYQVHCGTCETKVGVFDSSDGLYIFYNVFPSAA